jgi:DNA polymerase-3 subunit beta
MPGDFLVLLKKDDLMEQVEIRINVSQLTRALNLLQGAAQRKNSMAILSHVLLSTDEADNLVLSSTDLDIGMRIKNKCEIKTPGAVTVSVRSLLDLVKMLPGPEVTLKELTNRQLSVKSGRTTAKLMTMPALEFPILPAVDGMGFKSIEADRFLAMVQKTLYSTSNDDNRYNLTGVFWEPQKDAPHDVVMVSTDGHRLSRVRETFFKSEFSQLEAVTLPRKGLIELSKLMESMAPEEGECFQMGLSEQHAIILFRDSYLSMRLIEGKFPDYHQVIPKLTDKILRVSRNDFLLGLKRVSVLASEKNQSIRMKRQGR